MLISAHCSAVSTDCIHACTATVSTRKLNSVPPHTFRLMPKEVTATMVSVPYNNVGPPESPKQVPPPPRPGAEDSWTLRPLATPPVPMIHVSAIKRLRKDSVAAGLPLTYVTP